MSHARLLKSLFSVQSFIELSYHRACQTVKSKVSVSSPDQSYCLVVEELNSTKVVLDPLSKDGVFLSSVGQFTLHAPADVSIKSEGR